MADRWIKMGDAMSILGVSRKTMRGYCSKGVVKAKQIPAGSIYHWRVSEKSCNELGGGMHATALEHVRSLR